MTFKNYLCWQPEKVYEVINTDAEAVPEEIFLAVHTDYPLLVSESPNRETPLASMSAHDFLHQHFLGESRGDYVQVMVLGEAGSGKSHFIQWMNLNIPKRDDTYLFLIPKARTSLRTIVERIVGLLPPDLADPYRQQLQNSDPILLNERGKIDKLLDSLALAISQDQPLNIENESELEEYLINYLPHIFRDTYLRQSYFAANHPLISDLVNHVFSNRSINIKADNRREFSASDLNMSGRDYASAAVPTQEVWDIISEGPGSTEFDLALKIINRNLDKALTLTLSLTPQQLINMMTDLRNYLYMQDKRLILLVEDLALLQGIDNSLLQALTIPGRQGNEQLCALRWAAAVNTGYYLKLEDTARTRLTFRIEMDRPASEAKQLIGRTGLAKFAARYLNAVRIGLKRLQQWHQQLTPGDHPVAPSACAECQHQSICHAGFGAAEGYGLYPFTMEALWNMARRADSNLEQRFLPRTFLKEVLCYTLHGHADSLAIGQFPPAKLLVGYSKLNLVDLDKLKRLDPVNHDRRLAFLDIWHGKGQIVNSSSIIHDAFSLPPLQDIRLDELEKGGSQESKKIKEAKAQSKSKEKENPYLIQLNYWAQGHEMQETLAAELREALFETLWDYMDWDALKIDRPSVAGRKGAKPFTQLSFHFRNQTTRPNRPAIHISLPVDDNPSDFTKTAIALGGLLQFRNSGHWHFSDGDIALANLLECLQDWSNEITRQFCALPKYEENWNPGLAAVELLAIGRVLTGTKAEDVNPNTIISPESLPQVSMKSRELDNLISRLSKDHKSLQELVQAIYSGKKGGQKGRFIDPEAILEAIKRLRRSKWELLQSPPPNAPNPFGTVTTLYNRIKNELSKAVRSEVEARKNWYTQATAHFSPEESAKKITEKITAARDAMIRLGIPGSNVDDFDNLQTGFRRARPDHLLSANAFTEDYEGNEVLRRFALSRKAAMDAVDTFTREVQQMISKGEQGLASRRAEYDATIQPLTEVQTRIKATLANLRTALEAFQ
ncbi:MAG: protein DpdH [Candidatus Competibacteraceae bacterium]